MAETICVTGASGYIAAHIVRELLAKGYKVRGTVRSKIDSSKYDYLRKIPGASKRLKLFQSDLLIEDSFGEAFAGSDYLMHVASPYFVDSQDPQNDLVTPALSGTLNVLRSAKNTSSIKRVVLTSSAFAITDVGDSEIIFTEKDWNEKSTLSRDPYPLSKSLAEKAAWKFIEFEKTNFDLITINPSAVIGPSLGPRVNTSPAIIRDLLIGEYPLIMDLVVGYVDVRDVARAHCQAMEILEASGRYICNSESLSLKQLINLLKRAGASHYKLPGIDMSSKLGSQFVKLMSYAQPRWLGNYLRLHIGHPALYDNTKIKSELGMKFLTIEQSVRDTFHDLQAWGHIETISA